MVNNIGEAIGLVRKEKKLTQEELANMVGLNRVSIVKIENNQRTISLDEAMKISKALEIDLNVLYSYIKEDKNEEDKEPFLVAFKSKYNGNKNLDDVKLIELLVDALFTQEVIYRGE